jgi:hypothetical protein
MKGIMELKNNFKQPNAWLIRVPNKRRGETENNLKKQLSNISHSWRKRKLTQYNNVSEPQAQGIYEENHVMAYHNQIA